METGFQEIVSNCQACCTFFSENIIIEMFSGFQKFLFLFLNQVGFTVFHDSTMPPDDFIANCKISLSELIEKEDQPTHDVWVSFTQKKERN